MKKQFLLWAFAVLLLPQIGQSQLHYDWSFVLDEFYDSGYQHPIFQGRNGDYYVFISTGFFTNIGLDLDPSPTNTINPDPVSSIVAKYSATGNLLGFRQFAGNLQQFAFVDLDGNLYTSIAIIDSANIGNTSPHWVYSSAPTNANGQKASYFITKYNEQGDLIWTSEIGMTLQSGLQVKHWKMDNAGNLYLGCQHGDLGSRTTTGYQALFYDANNTLQTTLTTKGMLDMVVAKFAPDGTFTWAFNIGTLPQCYYGNCMAGKVFLEGFGIDPQGNVYVSGKFGGETDFNPDPIVDDPEIELEYSAAFIAKYNTNGQHQWAHSIKGTGNEQAWNLAVNSQGDVYVDVWIPYISDFDPTTVVANYPSVNNPNGATTHCLTKYNTNGNLATVKPTGTFANYNEFYPTPASTLDYLFLYCDAQDNLFLFGGMQGYGNLDILNPNTPTIGNASWAAFWSKYSPQEQFLEGYEVGGTSMRGILVDTQNDLVVMGYSDSCDMDLDISPTQVVSPTCSSSTTHFVAKYSQLLNSTTSILNTSSQLQVYPNPAYHATTLQYNSTSQMPYLVQIMDAQGRILQQSKYNTNSVELNLQHLPLGFYTIRVLDGNQQYHQKLLLQR